MDAGTCASRPGRRLKTKRERRTQMARKPNETTTCTTMPPTVTSPAAMLVITPSMTNEKTSSMNAAVRVVWPDIVLSIFDSSSRLMEIPTEVGAKAQPAAKPCHGYPLLSKSSSTSPRPERSGRAVPMTATRVAFLPTLATLSNCMCMPDSNIMRVTPDCPMKFHTLMMCPWSTHRSHDISSHGRLYAPELLAEMLSSALALASILPAGDVWGLASESHVPSLAYGTKSRFFGPKSMPTTMKPRILGKRTMVKRRPPSHTVKRKSVTHSTIEKSVAPMPQARAHGAEGDAARHLRGPLTSTRCEHDQPGQTPPKLTVTLIADSSAERLKERVADDKHAGSASFWESSVPNLV